MRCLTTLLKRRPLRLNLRRKAPKLRMLEVLRALKVLKALRALRKSPKAASLLHRKMRMALKPWIRPASPRTQMAPRPWQRTRVFQRLPIRTSMLASTSVRHATRTRLRVSYPPKIPARKPWKIFPCPRACNLSRLRTSRPYIKRLMNRAVRRGLKRQPQSLIRL